MPKLFIEVTPRLVHFNGEVKELGTVRYSIDEKVWPALRESDGEFNAMQQLCPPVMLANQPWSKIEFKVVFTDGDKPQPEKWDFDAITNTHVVPEPAHSNPHFSDDGGCLCKCSQCVMPRPGRAYASCICKGCNENCLTDKLDQTVDGKDAPIQCNAYFGANQCVYPMGHDGMHKTWDLQEFIGGKNA